MKNKHFEIEWARAQVEAMADGSLTRAERRRMRVLMHAEPELAAAVERARRLRTELASLGRVSVPPGLDARLLAIPGAARRPDRLRPWGVPLAAAAAGALVALTGLLVLEQTSQPAAARQAAVRDFQVAMSYLQRSAAVTGDEVTRELSNGLREAFAVSRSAVLGNETESSNGDEQDDQE